MASALLLYLFGVAATSLLVRRYLIVDRSNVAALILWSVLWLLFWPLALLNFARK